MQCNNTNDTNSQHITENLDSEATSKTRTAMMELTSRHTTHISIQNAYAILSNHSISHNTTQNSIQNPHAIMQYF